MNDTVGALPAKPVAQPARRRGGFWIGLLAGALLASAVWGGALWWRTGAASNSWFLMRNKSADGVVQTASGLQYKVLTAGKGAKPTDADVALVNYEGKLLDGTTFDKSEQPTPMAVAGVVPGFSEALKLMPKGAKYRIWLKPELGYGDKSAGPIPANSVLTFDVEMLDFLPESVIRQMQQQQQMMQQPGAAMPGAGGGEAPKSR